MQRVVRILMNNNLSSPQLQFEVWSQIHGASLPNQAALMLLPHQTTAKHPAHDNWLIKIIILLHTLKDLSFFYKQSILLFHFLQQPLCWSSSSTCSASFISTPCPWTDKTAVLFFQKSLSTSMIFTFRRRPLQTTPQNNSLVLCPLPPCPSITGPTTATFL